MLTERQLAVIFSLVKNIGGRKVERLRKYFGSLAKAFECTSRDKWLQTGWPEKEVDDWLGLRLTNNWRDLWREINGRVDYVTLFDEDYPLFLREIASPPLVLYYRGDLSLVKQKCLGVVGTRKATSYSSFLLKKWIPVLVEYGLVVVSGLALGVDSLAHRFCLNAGGLTIAVLAGGFEEIYPTINRRLAKDIVNGGGLLISEYPPNYKALPYNFPARNRIVSGLSKGVLVTEAPKKSGAMITAYMAMEQNRAVMTVGGDVMRETSQGCNQLIKQGALFVETVDDILWELGIKIREKKNECVVRFEPRNEKERNIYDCLRSGEKCIDELKIVTNIDLEEIFSILTYLSLEGIVEELAGGKWSIIN